MSEKTDIVDARAPSERRRQARWPMWRRVLAYAVLGALAAGSIVYIDRGVMRTVDRPPDAADQR